MGHFVGFYYFIYHVYEFEACKSKTKLISYKIKSDKLDKTELFIWKTL